MNRRSEVGLGLKMPANIALSLSVLNRNGNSFFIRIVLICTRGGIFLVHWPARYRIFASGALVGPVLTILYN